MGRASRRKRERRALGGRNLPFAPPASRSKTRKRDRRGKISAALLELVRPFVEENMSLEGYRNLVGIGTIAWNLSLVEDPRLDQVADLLEAQDDDDRAWLKAVIVDLIARKKRLFPEDERYIAKWEVTLRPDGGYRVLAAGVGFE